MLSKTLLAALLAIGCSSVSENPGDAVGGSGGAGTGGSVAAGGNVGKFGEHCGGDGSCAPTLEQCQAKGLGSWCVETITVGCAKQALDDAGTFGPATCVLVCVPDGGAEACGAFNGKCTSEAYCVPK